MLGPSWLSLAGAVAVPITLVGIPVSAQTSTRRSSGNPSGGRPVRPSGVFRGPDANRITFFGSGDLFGSIQHLSFSCFLTAEARARASPVFASYGHLFPQTDDRAAQIMEAAFTAPV
jgi:hypothetical protein